MMLVRGVSMKNIKTYNRYNDASKVVRCPNGKAQMRNELDKYAQAAINLYGIISKRELVQIFNDQNPNFNTTVAELEVVLLPLILKNQFYAFYKDYVLWFPFYEMGIEHANKLIFDQSHKPRFIPSPDEFLFYRNYDYLNAHVRTEFSQLLDKHFGRDTDFFTINKVVNIFMDDIESFHLHKVVFNALSKNDMVFDSEKKLERFLEQMMNIINSRRLWENKASTPIEVMAKSSLFSHIN